MFKQFPHLSVLLAVLAVDFVSITIYMFTHAVVGIPITISNVRQSHFVDYAGFPVPTREDDAQVVSFGEVTITNTSSSEKVALDVFLHITGPATDFKVRADLQGPFHMIRMIYGTDDWVSNRSPVGEPRKLFRSPIELEPEQIERKELVFVFDMVRDAISRIFLINSQQYNFRLEVTDLISRRTITIAIPGEYRG